MPWTIDYKNIAGLPIEARRLWVRIANDNLRDGRDEESAIKIAWSVIKNAGYSKRGNEWVKEAVNMLKVNLKGKIKRLKGLKFSNKHSFIIQEAEKMADGKASDDEVRLMMSKLDKASNHCIEAERRFGNPRTESERAQAHFKISSIEWSKLSASKKKEYIDKLPPRGTNQESAVTEEVLHGDYISFKEAKLDEEKREATITIIKAGFNTSKSRYYTKEALADAVSTGLFNGKKMYKNHLTEADEKTLKGMPRSIDDWVSTIKSTWLESDGSIAGKVKVVNNKFWDFLKQVKEDIGTSIDARGKIVKGMMEGIRTNIVNAFTTAKSVDWVTEAGAGGKVLLLENKEEDMDWSKITIAELEENVPELLEEVREQEKKKIKEANTMNEEDAKKLKEATDENAKLKEEAAEKDKKIKENDEAVNKIKCQEKVLEHTKDVKDIPELSIKKIQESLKDLNIKIEDVQKTVESAIKAERDYLLSLSKDGSKIKGLGETKESNKNKDTDKNDPVKEAKIKMYKNAGYTPAEIKELEEENK